MHNHQTSARRENGSTLLTVLFLCLTIVTVLGSFLALVSSRYKITTRARCWNAALPLAEAGIEETLTHLNDDTYESDNGWTAATLGGLPVYQKQRNFSNGNYYYITLYNPDSNNPVIYSTGFQPSPIATNTYISRTVKITGTRSSLISFAFAAVNQIQFHGNGVASDSFNSSDPNLSTNGQYDSSKTTTNGNVGSLNGPVDFGNHSISGNLYLGAGASSSVAANQVSGTIYSNSKLYFPDVVLPTTNWLAAPVAGSVHTFSLNGDYYVNDSLPIVVQSGVTVRVKVTTTSFSPSSITIASVAGVSGSLAIYQVSGSASMSGSVTVSSGRPRNFYYYGLPGVTSITYGGNSCFIGVMYAPEADLTLNGGGNNSGLIGASVTKTITMNGHYNFHFDEDLLNSGPSYGITVKSWTEM